ncbi:hypothetical protein [Gloeothece verrucosa]|uniref:hypothetical protein n=1 Tax=Gloeothece verrucosa TaxID=2546359 RepID=UPI00017E1753|nr:hypothetical protein [Gloeothece verrucosa]
MDSQNCLKTNQDPTRRARQIKNLIRKFKQKIQKIQNEGEVAPPNCHIIRYQVTLSSKNLLVL